MNALTQCLWSSCRSEAVDRFQMPDSRCRMPDTGYRIPDAGHRMPEIVNRKSKIPSVGSVSFVVSLVVNLVDSSTRIATKFAIKFTIKNVARCQIPDTGCGESIPCAPEGGVCVSPGRQPWVKEAAHILSPAWAIHSGRMIVNLGNGSSTRQRRCSWKNLRNGLKCVALSGL